MPFSSEYPFLDVHRTNALETNLMSVYVIRSYVQIASTSKHVVTKKKKKKKNLLLNLFLKYYAFA